MAGFRIDVADLLTHPGSRRQTSITEELDGLTGVAARVVGPVSVETSLERIPEGIVARGQVRVRSVTQCSRCLRDLDQTLAVAFDELFEPDPIEGETYPIEDHELDLEQLVRDAVMLELPLAPHCEEPCGPEIAVAGSEEPDPRWAVLSELELSTSPPPDPT